MINITADSRKIKKGDIFVAIPGFSSDGHDYIESAIENGASKVIAEHGTYNVPYEIVDNTRAYLMNYLKKHYNPSLKKIQFVGVTGTNGKTTTAYLIHRALRLSGIKSAYIGTIGFYLEKRICNLPNTCPDIWDLYDMFMQAKEEGCTYIIQEVSSHSLINGRVEGYDFDYAIFTNLTQDHLDFHHTMGNYALAKQILFKKLQKNGKAIINNDDKYKEYFLLKENKNITYGFTDSDYHVSTFSMNPQGTAFTYENKEETSTITMRLLGKYNVYNIMAAIAFLREIDFSKEEVEKIIPKLKAPLGRMDTIPYGTNSIIVDYAHTPDSVEKIIKTVKEFCKGNIYTVFGCTGDRDRTKRPIMMNIVARLSTKVIITNDDPHFEDPNQIVSDMLDGLISTNYEVCLDRKRAIIKGIDSLKENDVLLVLGKGHEEAMIIGKEHIPFNDRKVALSYLETINR